MALFGDLAVNLLFSAVRREDRAVKTPKKPTLEPRRAPPIATPTLLRTGAFFGSTTSSDAERDRRRDRIVLPNQNAYNPCAMTRRLCGESPSR